MAQASSLFLLLAAFLLPFISPAQAQGGRIIPPGIGRPPESKLNLFASVPSSRAYLGLEISILPGSDERYGVRVESVTPRSPADLAGIQAGDLIARVDDIPIGTDEARDDLVSAGQRFSTAIATLEPGKEALFLIRRGELTLALKLTPERDRSVVALSVANLAHPSDWVESSWTRSFSLANDQNDPRPGRFSGQATLRFSFGTISRLSLAPVNQELSRSLGIPIGVLVIAITPPGVVVINGIPVPDERRKSVLASDSISKDPLNLRTGDVIVAVDGRTVATPEQFLRVIGSYDRDDQLRLKVVREKQLMTITTSTGGGS